MRRGDLYTVDVLQDPDIREGIKQFANWPTIPQLYVNGEFVGGCDIMREMYQSGELQKLIAAAKKPREVQSADPRRARRQAALMFGTEIAIGPGKAELLDAIAATGSISESARRLRCPIGAHGSSSTP